MTELLKINIKTITIDLVKLLHNTIITIRANITTILEIITIKLTITETAIEILTQIIETETIIVKRNPTDHTKITILLQHLL
jgi:hypothetical protein